MLHKNSGGQDDHEEIYIQLYEGVVIGRKVYTQFLEPSAKGGPYHLSVTSPRSVGFGQVRDWIAMPEDVMNVMGDKETRVDLAKPIRLTFVDVTRKRLITRSSDVPYIA